MVDQPDQRILRLIRQVDEERAARLRAEKQASALRGQNTVLRAQLRSVHTTDQRFLPSPPDPDA